MKGLIFNCKNFSFRDTELAKRPLNIIPLIRKQELKENKYIDRILIFACIENGDLQKQVNETARHITNLATEWHDGNNNFLLCPFAHLSQELADPITAKKLLDKLFNKLTELGNSVEILPFGTHKEFTLDVYGYPRATSFFQFR
jgi:threonyl-tRNA synthetase